MTAQSDQSPQKAKRLADLWSISVADYRLFPKIQLLLAFHCHVDLVLTNAYEPTVRVSLKEISDKAVLCNKYCEVSSSEFELAKREIVRRIWERLGCQTGVDALKALSSHSGGQLQAAFHLAYRIAKVDQQGLVQISEDLIEGVSRELFIGRELPEADWLFLDWIIGVADATYGPKGILPQVRLIASRQLPLDPQRSFSYALDGFEDVFPLTFNMPLAESQNEFSLLYELGPMPVIQNDLFCHQART